jgi:predicted nucleic-acid-binding protein
VLVRAVVQDDARQSRAAARLLRDAELLAVALPCLCEFVWVLRRVYNFQTPEIAGALEALLGARNVVLNRPAVEAGLSVLRDGGDFADGAIAFEGAWLGGEVFVSFDKAAVALLARRGQSARLLDARD